MELYLVALYAHFIAVVATVAASSILHFNFMRMRRAATVSAAGDAVATIARVAPFMPLFALALFASGAWLVQMRWTWHDGWIVAGIVGLVSILLVSLIVQKPRLVAVGRMLREAKDGSLDSTMAAAIADRVTWGVLHFNHVMALAIMFVMVTKPSLGVSLTVLLLAPAAGVWSALSRPSLRSSPVRAHE